LKYDIDKDPDDDLGPSKRDDKNRVIKDHRALKNQSSVSPSDYPAAQLRDQSLVQPKTKKK
jgi:hypothetical protein